MIEKSLWYDNIDGFHFDPDGTIINPSTIFDIIKGACDGDIAARLPYAGRFYYTIEDMESYHNNLLNGGIA
jgi:hypothetical protein